MIYRNSCSLFAILVLAFFARTTTAFSASRPFAAPRTVLVGSQPLLAIEEDKANEQEEKMTSKEVHHHDSALAMAKAIREGKITSRELVEMHIDRIERLDGSLNAVIQRDFEATRLQADKADDLVRQWRNQDPSSSATQELPALCGVPITIKSGIPTPGYSVATGDPAIIWMPKWFTCDLTKTLFENSGVVLLGKTNVPIYLCDWESNNPVFGKTGNPYDRSRTPGGSSGGSAAALAAGFTPLEVGSDIGGSIRIPAAYCGVVGHCATRGVVPAIETMQLGCCGCLDRLLNSQLEKDVWMGRYGPMARTAEDVEALLDVLGGDVAAGLQRPKPNKSLSDCRVAIWKTHKISPPGSEVSHAIEAAEAALKAAGATVEELELPMDPFETYRIYLLYLSGFMKQHMPKEQKKNAKAGRPEDSYPTDIQSPFADMDLASVNGIPEGTEEAYEKAVVVWDEHLKHYDAVLAPIMPCKAWKMASEPRDMLAHAKVLSRTLVVDGEKRCYGDGLFWTHLSVLCGLPATGFPVEFSSDGIPVGLQAIGAKGNDYIVLDVVKKLMKQLGRDDFRAPAGFE